MIINTTVHGEEKRLTGEYRAYCFLIATANKPHITVTTKRNYRLLLYIIYISPTTTCIYSTNCYYYRLSEHNTFKITRSVRNVEGTATHTHTTVIPNVYTNILHREARRSHKRK